MCFGVNGCGGWDSFGKVDVCKELGVRVFYLCVEESEGEDGSDWGKDSDGLNWWGVLYGDIEVMLGKRRGGWGGVLGRWKCNGMLLRLKWMDWLFCCEECESDRW